MFEKCSDRTLQVVFMARVKARQRGAEAIEIGDLLAALVLDDQGGFVNAISGSRGDVTLVVQHKPPPEGSFFTSEIADELLSQLGAFRPQFQLLRGSPEVPLSQASIKALCRADSLHDEMHSTCIEPLHLLAAVMEHQQSKPAQILRDAGITREKIIPQIQRKP